MLSLEAKGKLAFTRKGQTISALIVLKKYFPQSLSLGIHLDLRSVNTIHIHYHE